MLLKAYVYQGLSFSKKRMKLKNTEGSWIGKGSIFYEVKEYNGEKNKTLVGI